MWTVVHFTKENAVEAVPSHWVKKDVCAWPKTNVRKHINHRTMVNKYDFDYFHSRTLKKGIGNYKLIHSFIFFYFLILYKILLKHKWSFLYFTIASYLEAKSKVKKAEGTSDLSTCDDEIETKIRPKKGLVPDPPVFNELLNKGKFWIYKTWGLPNYIYLTINLLYLDNLSKSSDNVTLKDCKMMNSGIRTVKRKLFDATSSKKQGIYIVLKKYDHTLIIIMTWELRFF